MKYIYLAAAALVLGACVVSPPVTEEVIKEPDGTVIEKEMVPAPAVKVPVVDVPVDDEPVIVQPPPDALFVPEGYPVMEPEVIVPFETRDVDDGGRSR